MAAVLVALVASACGSGVTTIAEDRALEPVTLEASPVEASPVDAAQPAPGGGHEYGATLEEWTAVEQAAAEASVVDDEASVDVGRSDYAEIEWQDLIPAGASGEELMARFEDRLAAVEPGSEEATALFEEIQAAYNPEAVNVELDGQQIRLAGFVAPLTYDDDIVTEFLLVPTFGACVHVPPPPPNQTILVAVDKADGLAVDDTWGAIWVEGTLSIDSATTDLAAASYKISNATSGVYSEF